MERKDDPAFGGGDENAKGKVEGKGEAEGDPRPGHH